MGPALSRRRECVLGCLGECADGSVPLDPCPARSRSGGAFLGPDGCARGRGGRFHINLHLAVLADHPFPRTEISCRTPRTNAKVGDCRGSAEITREGVMQQALGHLGKPIVAFAMAMLFAGAALAAGVVQSM